MIRSVIDIYRINQNEPTKYKKKNHFSRIVKLGSDEDERESEEEKKTHRKLKMFLHRRQTDD